MARFNYWDLYIYGLIVAFLYVEKVVGFCFMLWSLPLLCASHYVFENAAAITLTVGDKTYTCFQICLALHIFGWLSQFYGHGVHEGRKPALVTNLLFANFAFFFITFEVINHVFGYGEGKETDEVRKCIAADIKEYQASCGKSKSA